MPYEKALELARGIPMDVGLVPPPHPARKQLYSCAGTTLQGGYSVPDQEFGHACGDGRPPRPSWTSLVSTSAGLWRQSGRDRQVDVRGYSGRADCSSRRAHQGRAPAERADDGFRVLRRTESLHTDTRAHSPECISSAGDPIQFGSPVGWAPDAEDEMVKAVLDMHGEKLPPPERSTACTASRAGACHGARKIVGRQYSRPSCGFSRMEVLKMWTWNYRMFA